MPKRPTIEQKKTLKIPTREVKSILLEIDNSLILANSTKQIENLQKIRNRVLQWIKWC